MGVPEQEFRKKYQPDYTGMRLIEMPFAEMENHSGAAETYCLDLIIGENHLAAPAPVILFIHGGGFLKPNNKRQAYISRFAKTFTKAGYIVVSPDYPQFENQEQLEQLGGEQAGYQKAAEAIHLAYCYLRAHAAELNIDASRMAIIGGSAGSWAVFHALAAYPDEYRVFINCWGAPQQLPDTASFPPTLSIHGTEDTLVPFALEIAAQEALSRASIRHELIALQGSGHTPLDRMQEFLPTMMEWLNREMQSISTSAPSV